MTQLNFDSFQRSLDDIDSRASRDRQSRSREANEAQDSSASSISSVSSVASQSSWGQGSNDPRWGDYKKYALNFIDFIDEAPTTYHAVENFASRLERHGFTYLPEREDWTKLMRKGRRFYTTRNGTSLVAFVVGKNFRPANGAAITAAHIDALTLKVKPASVKDSVDGYRLIGVAPYAGSLSAQWWDRDLGIAGRLVVRQGSTVSQKLVHFPHPVGIVPSLAPHFGAAAQGPFNKETQMVPIVGLVDDGDNSEPTDEEKKSPLYGKHDIAILRALAKQAGVSVSDILQAELEMFCTQKGTLGGFSGEFMFCPRIDDKLCSYATLHGLLESVETIEAQDKLSIVALYDNEEIGSLSRQGAQGNVLESSIERLLSLFDSDGEHVRQFYANSFFASSDVIHAVNPNFSDVYLEHHKPRLNVGITVSWDPNGHMTTDAVSAALVEEVCRRTDNKVQYFQIRNDSRSGGTVGPYISSKNGIRAIDLGIPQLSMHSSRATTGSKDVWLGVRFYKAFFEQWGAVDAEFKKGDL